MAERGLRPHPVECPCCSLLFVLLPQASRSVILNVLDPRPPVLIAAAAAMQGYPAPWAIAGGWALDLGLGTARREHADLDLAVFRADQSILRAHLGNWRWEYASGGVLRPWEPGDSLALPAHELYATAPDNEDARFEFLLNEQNGADWIFRRDSRVRLPLSRAILPSPSGLPVLAPEIVLLYKAKAPRPADEADFRAALPALGRDARGWLAAALAQCHPGHPWHLALAPPEA